MYELLKESTDRCLVVRFSGKPKGDEVQQFVDDVEARLKKGGELNLVCDLAGTTGYGDTAAYEKDEEFTRGTYKKIRKAALVGDEKWIEWWLHFIAPHTPTEEKHFHAGQLKAAIEWASA
jgi:hypothetical protein